MDFDAEIRFEELPDALVAEVGLERALELTEKQPELLTEAIKKATEASGHALTERLMDDGPAMRWAREQLRRPGTSDPSSAGPPGNKVEVVSRDVRPKRNRMDGGYVEPRHRVRQGLTRLRPLLRGDLR